ncbi:MAG TPA: formate dehydrogenase, partial [Citreicella sp.]|nr:formate dehydrogenase [Citreicella sp.]
MSPEKMVMMANQIATFFATQPGTDGAERVADHLNDFWEPRMRAQLLDHAGAGGAG